MGSRPKKALTILAVTAAFAGLGAGTADAKMRSTKVGKHLCKTVGGGKFVPIPGFPGERVDRRLLPDIRWMKREYKIFITDAYAPSGHAANGEHPIGLALDIVPDSGHGGNWKQITRLAKRFEPQQNQVRPPMRWVGYNGDAGHGRGNHLHLSYLHSETRPRKPARKVFTRSCPARPGGGDGGDGGAMAAVASKAAGVEATTEAAATAAAPAASARRPSTAPAASPSSSSTVSPRPSPSTASSPGSRQDRAAHLRVRSPGVPAVAGSGQAEPRHMPATA